MQLTLLQLYVGKFSVANYGGAWMDLKLHYCEKQLEFIVHSYKQQVLCKFKRKIVSKYARYLQWQF